MSVSIEVLQQKAQELQKQFEAASQMMQQTAGALNMVNHLINQYMQEQLKEEDHGPVEHKQEE